MGTPSSCRSASALRPRLPPALMLAPVGRSAEGCVSVAPAGENSAQKRTGPVGRGWHRQKNIFRYSHPDRSAVSSDYSSALRVALKGSPQPPTHGETIMKTAIVTLCFRPGPRRLLHHPHERRHSQDTSPTASGPPDTRWPGRPSAAATSPTNAGTRPVPAGRQNGSSSAPRRCSRTARQVVGQLLRPPATWGGQRRLAADRHPAGRGACGAGNLPYQLVKANPAMGQGALTGVTHIQRCCLKGGVAPAAECSPQPAASAKP